MQKSMKPSYPTLSASIRPANTVSVVYYANNYLVYFSAMFSLFLVFYCFYFVRYLAYLTTIKYTLCLKKNRTPVTFSNNSNNPILQYQQNLV